MEFTHIAEFLKAALHFSALIKTSAFESVTYDMHVLGENSQLRSTLNRHFDESIALAEEGKEVTFAY